MLSQLVVNSIESLALFGVVAAAMQSLLRQGGIMTFTGKDRGVNGK